MADFNFEVQGADRLSGKFLLMAQQSPGTFDNTVGRWATRTANQLRTKSYPPTRPGQRYKRTRTLKYAWSAGREKSMEWRIENRAQQKGRLYASYVVGDEQAWMHKGRWWIASKEIEKKLPQLIKDLETEIGKFSL